MRIEEEQKKRKHTKITWKCILTENVEINVTINEDVWRKCIFIE